LEGGNGGKGGKTKAIGTKEWTAEGGLGGGQSGNVTTDTHDSRDGQNG